MKKIIEGKIWTAVCVALTLLMIVSAIWIGMRYYVSMDIYETPSMFLEGEYSVDGGEWKPIEKDRYITDHFNKIVFKGKMSKKLLMYFGSLTISSKNMFAMPPRTVWLSAPKSPFMIAEILSKMLPP